MVWLILVGFLLGCLTLCTLQGSLKPHFLKKKLLNHSEGANYFDKSEQRNILYNKLNAELMISTKSHL